MAERARVSASWKPVLFILALLGWPTSTGAEPFAFITNNLGNSVSVIDTATNIVVGTVPVGDNPAGVAVHPDGARVYVANSGLSADVSVIDPSKIGTAENPVIASVVPSIGPIAVAVNPAGTRLYVVGSGVSVIDTAKIGTAENPEIATISPAASNLFGVAVHPNGTRVYVASQGEASVVVIDVAKIGTAEDPVTIVPVAARSKGVVVHPNGASTYVANWHSTTVSVIDTATNVMTTTVAVGFAPCGITANRSGSRLYVANQGDSTVSVIDPALIGTASNPVIATVPVGNAPCGVSVTPDGARVYVANVGDNTVSIIETATNTAISSVTPAVPVPVGNQPFALGQFIGPETPRFPVDGSGWFHTPGSSCHYPSRGIWGSDDTYALDLNLPGGLDKDKPVFAIEDGTVRQVHAVTGWVLIEHSGPVEWRGRSYSSWFSGYMHMRKISVSVGESVKKEVPTQIGQVWDSGSTGQIHLHFVAYVGKILGPKPTPDVSRPNAFLESFDVGLVFGGIYTDFEYGDLGSGGNIYSHIVDEVVTDSNHEFQRTGNAADWFETSAFGFENHIFYTHNAKSTDGNVGRWLHHEPIPESGTNWGVYVFMPRKFSVTGRTSKARYRVFRNGEFATEKAVSQAMFPDDRWVNLSRPTSPGGCGTALTFAFEFSEGDVVSVELGDATGEKDSVRVVGYDAVRIFKKQDLCLPRKAYPLWCLK